MKRQYRFDRLARPHELDKAEKAGVWPPMFHNDGGPRGRSTVPVTVTIEWNDNTDAD